MNVCVLKTKPKDYRRKDLLGKIYKGYNMKIGRDIDV